MLIFDIIKKLQMSPEFLKWKSGNKPSFLMSLYALFEEKPDEWLIGYYNPATRKVATFTVGASIAMTAEDETDKAIMPLDMEKVKVEMETALGIAKEAFAKKSQESIKKTIAVLQNLGVQVWNISFMTASFNIYNIRIDSETGKIAGESYGAMFAQA